MVEENETAATYPLAAADLGLGSFWCFDLMELSGEYLRTFPRLAETRNSP
jgi:hypothetical protein